MDIVERLLIALGLTVLLSVVTVLRQRMGGRVDGDVVRGAIIQSALFGFILGLLFIPNAPSPPPFDGNLSWFVGALLLVEFVRTGLYMRLPFIPKAVLSYRLAALRIKLAQVERSIQALERRMEGRSNTAPPLHADKPA